ncbi:hypothetical protein PPERSA_03043 [Pseudocohnilembus persalinus]|uniref:Uncharacterized protein n=1 Tax=Pseudocohnilembus persalinus TaxID=266149 RepID=A0A0V0QF03_PSEPJ|nr:hypothetical protein PPERSA_03043 [Pseudocohnilembus persalinus]|eukprot:KRX00783.1 hypothetical protein PPERSA_03043 [Pseudocohnilembus persalinus]
MEQKYTSSPFKQRQEQKKILTKQQQWNNDIKVEKNTKFQKFTVLADKTLHIDEFGRQFTILKYITMEDVLEVLQDQGKSIKLQKKWDEYVKMAQKLGIQNLKDMVDNADLILDALRGPPNFKQKFYWDQNTNERYKCNPDFKIVQAEYQLRTNNKCIILEPIQEQEIINFSQGLPQQYLIKDISIKYNKKFDKFPEANPLSIVKKTALEIGMQTVKQIQKEEFKPILLKGLNPNDGWDRAIFIKSNTLGFINTITQERVDQHPFLNKLRQEFREAVKFFNYDIVKEVSEIELKNFLEYDQKDSDKMDTRMKEIKSETEKTAFQIGMQNFDDMLNFRNILFEGLKPPYG